MIYLSTVCTVHHLYCRLISLLFKIYFYDRNFLNLLDNLKCFISNYIIMVQFLTVVKNSIVVMKTSNFGQLLELDTDCIAVLLQFALLQVLNCVLS